eukprot:1611460-Pyramimonas_sp.AAC.1
MRSSMRSLPLASTRSSKCVSSGSASAPGSWYGWLHTCARRERVTRTSRFGMGKLRYVTRASRLGRVTRYAYVTPRGERVTNRSHLAQLHEQVAETLPLLSGSRFAGARHLDGHKKILELVPSPHLAA